MFSNIGLNIIAIAISLMLGGLAGAIPSIFWDPKKQRMREAKDYIWEDQFKPKTLELLEEIDEQSNLRIELVEVGHVHGGDIFSEDYPDDFSHDDVEAYDIIPSFGDQTDDIAFTPQVQEITTELEGCVNDMTKLEDYQLTMTDNTLYASIALFIMGLSIFAVGTLPFLEEVSKTLAIISLGVIVAFITLAFLLSLYQFFIARRKDKFIKKKAKHQERNRAIEDNG